MAYTGFATYCQAPQVGPPDKYPAGTHSQRLQDICAPPDATVHQDLDTALCLTVDAPVFGRRERDIRSHFHLPPGMSMKNLRTVGLEQLTASEDESALQRYINEQLDDRLTWEVLESLRGVSSLPLIVKGILAAEDARLAVESGANAIIVSNHGGRQLDGSLSTCEALPKVVDAVDAAARATANSPSG